jgi:hypothetical protein
VPPTPTAAELIPDWLAPDERAIAELAMADPRVVARLEGEHYEFLDVTDPFTDTTIEGREKGDVGWKPPEVELYIYNVDKYLRIPVDHGVVLPHKEYYAPTVGFAGLSPREIETAVGIAMADPDVAKLVRERGFRPLPTGRPVRAGGITNSTCETYRCVLVTLITPDEQQFLLVQVDLGARSTVGMLLP